MAALHLGGMLVVMQVLLLPRPTLFDCHPVGGRTTVGPGESSGKR